MTAAIFPHLQASSRVEAALDSPTRIKSLWRDRWIDYPRASQALLKLEHLLETPPKERTPCMELHGDSNISKTLIVAKFQLLKFLANDLRFSTVPVGTTDAPLALASKAQMTCRFNAVRDCALARK